MNNYFVYSLFFLLLPKSKNQKTRILHKKLSMVRMVLFMEQGLPMRMSL